MNWPMYRRVERRASRMHEVMERLDVDAVALARLRRGNVYAEARALCLTCGTSDLCLRWLDNPEPPQRRPEFCPNLSWFEACKRQRPRA
jgi:hypothetical protein